MRPQIRPQARTHPIIDGARTRPAPPQRLQDRYGLSSRGWPSRRAAESVVGRVIPNVILGAAPSDDGRGFPLVVFLRVLARDVDQQAFQPSFRSCCLDERELGHPSSFR